MGRNNVEIKLIENRNKRHVAFSRRKKGLFKRARQLSIQSDVQVATIVFSDCGRLYQSCHGNRWSSLEAILQQYHDVSDLDEKEATGIHESKNSERENSTMNMNFLQKVERYLDELNFDELTVADLVQLERDMEITLAQTRTTKASNSEKMLREENELLMQQIAAMKQESTAAKEMDDNRELNIEFRNLANNETDHSPPRQTLKLL